MAANWPVIDALLAGTTGMRAAGKAYLPQWPNEADEAYRARLATATLFPAFSRTVSVLSGKPFSRPLTLDDDVPESLRAWADNIDLQGSNLHSFAGSITQAALSHGLAGILVDYPKASGLKTRDEEKRAGVRPYFVQIKATDILGWRSERIAGVETLTQLRFLESVVEYDGPFGEKIVEQVRVLEPGKWSVWRKKQEPNEAEPKWVLHDEGETSLKKVPFVPVYGERVAFMQGRPPLMELAHMNVEHWQSKSDQQTILHIARVPILFAKNLGDSPIVVGAAQAVKGEGEGADLKFVEHSGQAIEAGRLSILDLEDRMRQIGAELLVIKPGNTSVTQTLADNEPGMCVLQRLAEDVEDALEAALQLMAEWVGEKNGGHIQIYKDFGVASLAEASMELLREMNIDGTFSDESLFREGQRRGIIMPELAWEEEQKRIEKNRPKPGKTQLNG
ncbi:DUF4055 domain-containing protein [Chromobacterium amazonense]|nr:DUF4055 domain-containing protein [Chromobacterium amazonense]